MNMKCSKCGAIYIDVRTKYGQQKRNKIVHDSYIKTKDIQKTTECFNNLDHNFVMHCVDCGGYHKYVLLETSCCYILCKLGLIDETTRDKLLKGRRH